MQESQAAWCIPLAATLLFTACPASAHDEWLQPSAFQIGPGGHLDINVMVDERFVGVAVPRRDERTTQFIAAGPDGSHVVATTELKMPYGHLDLPITGSYQIDFVDKYQQKQFDSKTFEAYLEEKGLDDVITARRESGASGSPGREAFSHYLKLLVRVGKADNVDRRLGLKFEIVADSMAVKRASQNNAFLLLFDGKPISHILVTATNHRTPDTVLSARTDETGHVSFPLNASGQWLIHAVHMLPASGIRNTDWHSFWASLTFDLP